MSGKVVITGITGTFGHAYLTWGEPGGPIYGISRDEQKQFALRQLGLPGLRLIQGDIRDRDKLRMAFRGASVVIHAAANKIVPQGAYNVDELIKTNVEGSRIVFEEAIHAGVGRVLYISTDKAVEPTTTYGASKLLSEQLAIMMNDWSDTSFACVRYGNVEDSRGSFTHAIKNWTPSDPPLQITDPRCTRFWITQKQAVAFVDLALARMGNGGQVFVPKLPSRRLLDLLPRGANFEVIGLRNTEKLHETLIGAHEVPHTDDHGAYFTVHYPPYLGTNALEGPYCSGGGDGSGELRALPAEVSG